MKLLEEVKTWAQELKDTKFLQCVAASLEVCPREWQQNQRIKLHVHLFFQGKSTICIYDDERSSSWFFKGSRPTFLNSGSLNDLYDVNRGNPSASKAVKQMRCRKQAPKAAMYYLCCPKKGSVGHWTSHQPWEDFVVPPSLITQLVALKKMTFEAARREFYNTATDVKKYLDNLKTMEKEESEKKLVALKAKAKEALFAGRKRRKRIVDVERWLAEGKKLKDRYSFLVLDGPSKMGKTAFCEALVGPDALFQVNCERAIEPDLREKHPVHHTGILFDEGTPQMVMNCKRLFQAAPSAYTLGQSASNCNAYQVWVHQNRMMITSNKWKEDLKKLAQEDQDWIQENSVYVAVTEKLYVED